MPIFKLGNECIFPPADLAAKSGILAIGGDLSSDRLLAAYRQGIFPWYSDGEPLLWWSPDPRFVLFPKDLRISRSMKKVLRRGAFTVTFDRDFGGVIAACRKPRKNQDGTWITEEMVKAYHKLHLMGFAHSAEVWQKEKLVGGIYGVSLGLCFFGESMFSEVNNASKVALIHLLNRLKALEFRLLDCQVYTSHMESLGARFISRTLFMRLLEESLGHDTVQGNWHSIPEFTEGYL
jgi:leucyl/phenylalanyl-tRNA---protein transferase